MKLIMIDGYKVPHQDFIKCNGQEAYDELMTTGRIMLSDYKIAELIEDGYLDEIFSS